MKTRTAFLSGALAGAVLMFVILFVIGTCTNNRKSGPMTGMEFFNSPQDVDIKLAQPLFDDDGSYYFEIMQALNDNSALSISYGDVFLLYSDTPFYPYDSQRVTIQPNQILKRIGTYKYENTQKELMTVPIVSIFDRE